MIALKRKRFVVAFAPAAVVAAERRRRAPTDATDVVVGATPAGWQPNADTTDTSFLSSPEYQKEHDAAALRTNIQDAVILGGGTLAGGYLGYRYLGFGMPVVGATVGALTGLFVAVAAEFRFGWGGGGSSGSYM